MNAIYTLTSPANSPVNISQKKHSPTYSKNIYCCLLSERYSTWLRGYYTEWAHSLFPLPREWEFPLKTLIIHSLNNFTDSHLISSKPFAQLCLSAKKMEDQELILYLFLNTSNCMIDYQVLLVKLLPGTYTSLKHISKCDLRPLCPWKRNCQSTTPSSPPVTGGACAVVSCHQPFLVPL